ncbi:MAG: DUF4157 domain-containing protein [Blastocatellia bacterium]|nr:DUF4157 domain-containing protein [Blastocatellia bacterium]
MHQSTVASGGATWSDEIPIQKIAATLNQSSVVQTQSKLQQGLNQSPKVVGQARLGETLANRTGLPDDLKTGMESLSGLSLDDVTVHYNSSKPAQLQALAYTQGTDIHVAPGEEKHLAHEAWHVIQQKQGRVAPTTQMKGIAVNDDSTLEREADVMGAKAVSHGASGTQAPIQARKTGSFRASPRQPGPVQLAKTVTKPNAEEDLEEYVVVDVPGDGSCLLHAFNLGYFTQNFVRQLRQQPSGTFTADQVEQMVREEFRQRIQKPIDEPSLATAYDESGMMLRGEVVKRWNQQPGDYFALLQTDVQAIVARLLEGEGLLKRESPQLEEEDMDSAQKPEETSFPDFRLDFEEDLFPVEDRKAEAEEGIGLGDADFDFAFNAIYHPERFKDSRKSKPFTSSGKSFSSALFGVSTDEIKQMYIPMGVEQEGTLAKLLREYVIHLGKDQAVGEYLPLQSVVVPPFGSIPEGLVQAYKEEFAENPHLWASKATLQAASSLANTSVCVNTFAEEEFLAEDTDFPGTQGQINLFESDEQTHFQVMIGPFPLGWLKAEPQAPTEVVDDPVSESRGDSMRDEPFFDFGPSSSQWPSSSGFSFSESQPIPTYFDPHEFALPFNDLVYVKYVIDDLGFDFASPGKVIQLIYRAAAMLNVPDVFERSPKVAAQVVREYLRMVEERTTQSDLSQHASQRRDPIIPLVGFIEELVNTFGIPKEEINQLLPHAIAYLKFHRKFSSWKESGAGPRVTALQEIANLLNQWAEDYDAPDLLRGPSLAQHTAVPSPLGRGESVGTTMRSLLTINPGNLVGFEPEETETWSAFREALSGFVRAHLLNKHLGGVGSSHNIAFMSSEDNTRMSQLGEEYVKREVIENNKQLFFGVEMPLGRPELTGAPHFLSKDITDVLVKEVRMRVAEVTPFTNEDEEPELEFAPTYLKEMMGIEDADVQQSNTGVLSFPTKSPDPKYVSKLQPHWGKKIKETSSKASNLSLDTMFLDPRARDIMVRAQKALLHNDDVLIKNQILAETRQRLEPLLDPEQLEIQMQKLGEVRRQSGSTHQTEVKTEQKAMRNTGKRRDFLDLHGVTPGSEIEKAISGASDMVFLRIKTLLANGATLRDAVTYGTKRKKAYEQFLSGLQRKKKGTDIMSLFK